MLKAQNILCFLKEQNIRYERKGNVEISVESFTALDNLSDNKLIWIKENTMDKENEIENFKNMIILSKEKKKEDDSENCWILCENPKMCYFSILEYFFLEKKFLGIASTAIVNSKKIGNRTSIGHGTFIGENAEIGENVEIGHNVTIDGKVRIGNNCVIESGTVIGKSGFGYYKMSDGYYKKVPHFGGVIIQDNVEIGANSCIDCGTIGDTVIGFNTKIDNLCHIGHNVQMDENVMVVAGSVICGSCKIGSNSYIAPGAVIKNQLSLGENSFVGIQTAVMKNVKEEESIFGVPGRTFKREYNI